MIPHQNFEATAELSTADLAPTTKIHGSVHVSGAFEPVRWTAEFPDDELAYGGLALLVPGFGGIKVSSRGERHSNAVSGIPCISYEPARLSPNVLTNLLASQGLHVRTASAVMTDASAAVRGNGRVPNRPEIDPDRFLLSAHSMGGFAATGLGLQRHGQIESIVYKASPGFGRYSINPVRFVSEFNDLRGSGEIEPSLWNYARFTRYFLSNPSRTVGEAVACMTLDNRPQVARLGELGINLAYLGFEGDNLVPPHQVMSAVREVIDTTYVMPDVGHLAPQHHPQQVSDKVFELHALAAA